MTRIDIPLLSKTRFIGGLQCLRRLFLQSYYPELMPFIDPSHRALFDCGNEIRELARDLYPGGHLIEEKAFEHARAVSSTQQVVADESVPAVYEAAFFHDRIRIRVDLLKRLGHRRHVSGSTWAARSSSKGSPASARRTRSSLPVKRTYAIAENL